MKFDLETIYRLLPAFYRIRDVQVGERLLTDADRAEIVEMKQKLADPLEESDDIRNWLDEKQRGPLKALLSIIAEQIAVLEEGLEQLYNNQFIETCDEWVVPYIGDLVGTGDLFEFPEATFSQRAQVANTLSYRRRKGTAAVIEQLARDVTNWDTNVVEYFKLLATTQYTNHPRPDNISMADLRNSEALEFFNTPFDPVPRTVDVRRIEARRGRYNIPNMGIFLWRLGSYSSTRTPAFKVDDRRYCFDALGRDIQLQTRPQTEETITHLAEPLNVPMPIKRSLLRRRLSDYYGNADCSILIYRNGVCVRDGLESPPISSPPVEKLDDLICVCNLNDIKNSDGQIIGWSNMPENKIAIDPELGRFTFPENQPAPEEVRVTYHYGFSARMGGGEYGRAETFDKKLRNVIKVPSDQPTIQDALDQLANFGGVVEIENNDYFHETPQIAIPGGVPEGKKIELRAADERRPILGLDGDLLIFGGNNAELTINGLIISGGRLRVPAVSSTLEDNQLHRLHLIHCTLLSGISPTIQSPPVQPSSDGLVVESPNTQIEIEKSIIGGLCVDECAQIEVRNSIIDAGCAFRVAYRGLELGNFGGALQVENSTIIGKVRTKKISLALNTIFFSEMDELASWPEPVAAERIQEGCLRFSYVPPGSRVPRKYNCQPINEDNVTKIRPVFNTLRYGDAGYCQLSLLCPEEIRRGAEDQAEMGAFHDLYQPQREANLRVRLKEYLRFGLEAGIFFAS